MAYTQPSNTSVDFELTSYTPPDSDAADFDLSSGVLAAPTQTLELTHPTADISGSGPATLDAPTQSLDLTHPTADIAGSGPATLDAPTNSLEVTHPIARFIRPRNTPSIRSDGWTVAVTHPATGRILSPAVLDEPQITPSILGQPRIRVPVPRDQEWLDPVWDDDPELRVWQDGVEQPIDVLREVEHEDDRTILVGVGGIELEQRVRAEYRAERRHLAAESLINQHTSYTADVDTPNVTTLVDQLMQALGMTSEFTDAADISETDPVDISGDEVTLYQTCFTQDWFEFQDSSSGAEQPSGDDYSDGVAWELPSQGEWVEWEFDLGYTIPQTSIGSDNFTLDILGEIDAISDAAFNVYLDGTQVISDRIAGWDLTSWSSEPADSATDYGELSPGTYTLRVERADSNTDDSLIIDVIAPNDGRFAYNFDTGVHQAGGYLDGPGYFPDEFTVAFSDAVSAFAVVEGSADVTVDSTAGPQRLQISNDRGETWEPSNGDENNTASVTVDFGTDGSALRYRMRFGAYGGPRSNQTPRFDYQAHTLLASETHADIEQALLLIDETYDADLETILNDIAGDQEFIWSYRVENGTPALSWTQPGHRTADSDPDIGDSRISKDATTWEKIVIKGSPQPVTGERFDASTSFEPLENGNLIPGEEAVYDTQTGENYERGADYELNSQPGEIRRVGGGDLNASTEYAIDYQFEVEGSYTLQSAGANPKERVETVPGVTSTRQAEQIAYILAQEFGDPRYTADLEVPRADVGFDVLDAFTLANLDLPASAAPLEVRGDPAITPRGVSVRLGSRGRLEEALSDFSEQLRQVSQRS